MNEKPRSSTCFILSISAPISFLIGLIIGLVVLGWWLWPVQWTNGDPSVLAPDSQQDYLNAAVDAYAYNGDDALAKTRYDSLGAGKQQLLAQLYASQPERAADIERFAAGVGASEALGAPAPSSAPEETPQATGAPLARLLKQPALLIGSVCIGLLLIIAVILIVVALVNRGRKRPGEAPETISPEPPAPADHIEPADEAGLHLEEEAPDGERGIPDWLDETTATEPYETLQSGGAVTEAGRFTEEAAEADIFSFGEELPVTTEEELSDEDIAAITSQEFAPTGGTLAGSAEREDIHFPGSTAAVETDEFEADRAAWLEEPLQESTTAEELPVDWFQAPAEEPATPTLMAADETPEETQAKFSQDIGAIVGIQPHEAECLRSMGISVPLLLLRQGASRESRQEIARECQMDEDRLLHWINYIDLFRVKGVDQQNAELLETAGIDSIATLAASDASTLYNRILLALEANNPGHRSISLSTIEAWIAQAQRLPQTVTM